MDGDSTDDVTIDLGDPHLGVSVSTDGGISNQGFEGHDEIQPNNNQTDLGNDAANEDYTVFLNEIAGDVDVPEDEQGANQPPMFSIGLPSHTNLGDIAEEEEENDKNNQKPQNKVNQTIIVSDSEGEEEHGELSDKHLNPRKHGPKGRSAFDHEGKRVGSQSKIGQRRSSMTPLGMTPSYLSMYRKLSMPHLSENDVQSKFDHTPHELFVELDELQNTPDGHFEWKQRARWIKFEENIEEGAHKWGKPHVSSLSFHSLLDLRKCLEQGVVLLDLEESTMQAIASKIAEELCTTDQLRKDQKVKVQNLLLHKHKHLESWSFLSRSGSSQLFSGSSARRRSSAINDQNGDTTRRKSLFPGFKTSDHKLNINSADNRRSSLPDVQNSNTNGFTSGTYKLTEANGDNQDNNKNSEVIDDLPTYDEEEPLPSRTPSDPAIMKRIPEGAETAAVLVGEVQNLDKPMAAFVRLSEGRDIDNLTEVPLPVRFIFVLMGPPNTHIDYVEIGRSISTLMSNTLFHQVAYLANSRTDLLKALNGFLDDSIVLPPGDIDRDVLLPIIGMAKRQKKKKEKEIQDLDQIVAKAEPPADPLKRTGRPFGGVVNDVKKRYPLYWSDIKDAFNIQCLATFFFVYFACLSPAITFGGLLSEKTDSYMGVTEMLLGTFACGVVFSLLSGQPLLILGGTGPILIFEEGLYQFCASVDIDFLSMRCWVGFWVTIVALIVIAVEGVFLVRYFTRFTEEIFASLISLIFIIEVFIKINKQFQSHPLQEYYLPIPGCLDEEDSGLLSTIAQTTVSYFTNLYNNQPTTVDPLLSNNTFMNNGSTTTLFDSTVCYKNKPNTALLSVILTFTTFFIAYFLKQFRNSHFLGRTARRALGDFGIPIAIVTLLIVDIIVGDDTYTEKLNVPDGMVPTNATKRGWFVNPLGHSKSLPVWCMFAAVLPALLLFILLFMESLITSVIVNKPDRKLQKGTGYHLDMLLVGLFATFGGVIGTPFLSVATVRSVTHVSALTVFSKSHAPGEKPKLVEVKEQRLTAFLVHIMIGLSTLLGPVLRHIPLAVLFGVFLYMGVASMSGIQLFERVKLIFMPGKHHPNVGYTRKVRLWKMHLFTVIQLLCLAVLWAVKSTKAALAFPFVLILMVPMRLHLLKFIFTQEELHELDTAGEDPVHSEDEDSEDEPDFYKQAHMPF